MRLLVDTCVAVSVYEQLLDAGHDVVYVANWDEDPGDREILQFASKEDRVIITLDKHFADLTSSVKSGPQGVVRLRNHRIKDQGRGCIEALDRYGAELQQGAVVVVQPGKIRCIMPW